MFQLTGADISTYFFPPNFREHQDFFVVELIYHRADSRHDGPLVGRHVMLFKSTNSLGKIQKPLGRWFTLLHIIKALS